jgi:hypothetical protein
MEGLERFSEAIFLARTGSRIKIVREKTSIINTEKRGLFEVSRVRCCDSVDDYEYLPLCLTIPGNAVSEIRH